MNCRLKKSVSKKKWQNKTVNKPAMKTESLTGKLSGPLFKTLKMRQKISTYLSF